MARCSTGSRSQLATSLSPLPPTSLSPAATLPRPPQINFFVLAVQTLTELRVSIQRIDNFLATPEPPQPADVAAGPSCNEAGFAAGKPRWAPQAMMKTAEPAGNGHSEEAGKHGPLNGGAQGNGAAAGANGNGEAHGAQANSHGFPVGFVAMRGADYDWSRSAACHALA